MIVKRLSSAVSILMVLLVAACNEPTDIGANLINDDDRLESIFTDTLSIDVSILDSGPINTGENNSIVLRPAGVGAINDDPVFGKAFAGVYFQMEPQDPYPFYEEDPDNLSVHALTLIMRYVDVTTGMDAYGDTLSMQNLAVYRMTEELANDAEYFSDQDFSVDEDELGRLTNILFEPDLTVLEMDMVLDTLPQPQIRFDLTDTDLADELLAVLTDQSDSSYLKPETFKDKLNGLYVRPDTTLANNAIASFNILNGTQLLLEYIDASDNDTLSLNFLPEDSCRVVNRFIQDYSTASDGLLTEVIVPGEEEINVSEHAFLQGMGGWNMLIDVPHLAELGNILVNQADLYLTVADDDFIENETYALPPKLDVRTRNEEGETFATEEFFREETELIDTTETPFYRIPLNFLVQALTDEENAGQRILITVSNVESAFNQLPPKEALLPDQFLPHRLVLCGPDHPDPEKRMRLELNYTKID